MIILMLNSPIEEIKSRLGVVEVIQGYIKVHKAGANYRANCPFHSEKKPSFFISPARQIWHCFGCGLGGDIFKFVMQIEGVEFGDALRILAQKAGIELVKQDPKLKTERLRQLEICDLAALFFERQLEESEAGKKVKEYLLGRGVTEESIKKWRLGYSPSSWQGLSDFLVSKGYKREEVAKAGLALKSEKSGDYYDRFRGRIMFPVFNLSSQVVGFGGRIFGEQKRPDGQEEAKYINTPNTFLYDKSRILYGLNKAGIEIRKKDACIMVEGYMDAIMVSQAGFENVVATSGTALTDHHLRIIKRYSENLLSSFDMDIAGNSATKRGIDLAQALGFNIKVVVIPQEKDPADLILKNPKIWEQSLNNAKTIHDFYLENALSKFDKNTIEGKKGISGTLLPVIKRIPNKIEQDLWIQSLANTLNVKEENILEELGKVKSEQTERPADDIVEKEALKESSRKDMLEEYLLALLVACPQGINLIGADDLKIFSSHFTEIIDYIKKSSQGDNSPPEALKEKINYISLRADLIKEELGLETDKELKCCLKEIKKLGIKDKMEEINRQMKQAEDQNDSEKTRKLKEEFDLCSKSRQELEAA